jgi:hypothetical protein
MSQNSGKKMPKMNMTQWPFLNVVIPSVTTKVIQKSAYKPPPIPHHITRLRRFAVLLSV